MQLRGSLNILWLLPFILSVGISPLISSSILGTYQPGEFIFQCPIFLPFHSVHGVLKARILKWLATPFSSGQQSVRPLHHDPSVLGGPTWHGCFTELDKAVVLWSDWLVFCDCGFSLSALWCPLSVPTVLLGFLLPWTWGIFMAAPAKRSHCLLPQRCGSSSRPRLCAVQPPTLWKCYTQQASKFGKLSNGHRTGKGQFSFQTQRKAMSKNAQTTIQLHPSHTLVK